MSDQIDKLRQTAERSLTDAQVKKALQNLNNKYATTLQGILKHTKKLEEFVHKNSIPGGTGSDDYFDQSEAVSNKWDTLREEMNTIVTKATQILDIAGQMILEKIENKDNS